ncbi:MAG: hypothetical protein FWH22_08635, partial [Fibromonadales bacterium]|nr:hypothetical protein [Fibromonadales bacterium]
MKFFCQNQNKYTRTLGKAFVDGLLEPCGNLPEFLGFSEFISKNRVNPLIGVIGVLTILLLPLAAQGQTTVSNFDDLQTQINDCNNDKTIVVANDINITAGLSIPGSCNLTIKSDGTTRTLTRSAAGDLFTVAGGGNLTLEDIIIDGNKNAYPDNNGSLVRVSGML